MSTPVRNRFLLGAVAGAALAATASLLVGQSASTPVKSDVQYFATGEGDAAHLWVREGASLRCVGHGECTAHKHGEGDHGHHEGDGHDHK